MQKTSAPSALGIFANFSLHLEIDSAYIAITYIIYTFWLYGDAAKQAYFAHRVRLQVKNKLPRK